uniref:Uncharacterized protein n=1 Tax=Oryza punctata TaxID=4537 RepID=A0A0E0JH09_ORYPU
MQALAGVPMIRAHSHPPHPSAPRRSSASCNAQHKAPAAVAANSEDDVSSQHFLIHYECNFGIRRALAVLPLEFP